MFEDRCSESSNHGEPHREAWDAGLAVAFGVAPLATQAAAGSNGARPSSSSFRQPVVLHDSRVEGEAPVAQPHSPEVPAFGQIGKYQLHGEIARGGMGAVLRGRDVMLGRELAVKVLLSTHKDNPEVARRFVEEAQIAGQLQHPGIAPVYELGEFDDRRPFFAMKLVKGQTLASLLNKRKDPAQDRQRFLAIFEQVCQTMAYAHSRGVIHRDLKPSNVMVGAFGEVQVMDWGLAKVLAAGGVADEWATHSAEDIDAEHFRETTRGSTRSPAETHAGAVLGTPAFMPPEQATGDVDRLDERCDVFGLGAILCVILTGSPPYVANTHDEVLSLAKSGDLAAAYARMDAGEADRKLIQLAKRCLEADCRNRPADAGVVAAELGDYLRSVESRLREAELAQARAQTKAQEEGKRRRITLALAASVLATIVAAGGAWGYVVYQQSARESQLAQRRVAVAQQIGEALVEADRFKQQARSAPWADHVAITRAAESARRAETLLDTGPVDEALEQRVRRLRAEIADETRQRELAAGLEAARMLQTEVNPTEGRFLRESAIPAYEQSLAGWGAIVAATPPEEVAIWLRSLPEPLPEMLIAALDHWILLEKEYPSEPQRIEWLRQVVKLADDDAWRRRVRGLVEAGDFTALAASLNEPEAEGLSATVLNTQAAWLVQANMQKEAVALLKRAQQKYPGDFWINSNLGAWSAQLDPPQFEDAIHYSKIAVSLRPESAGAHLNLGLILAWREDGEGAVAAARRALKLEPDFAKAHMVLGLGLALLKRYDEALAEHRAALDSMPKWPYAHYSLGKSLKSMGDLEGALASYQTALELGPDEAWFHYHVAEALYDLGRYDQALAKVRDGLARDKNFDPCYNLLGLVLQAKGDLAGAKQAYEDCLALAPGRPAALHNLGNVYLAMKQPREAVAYFLAALEHKPEYADAHNNLGLALKDIGELEAAIESHKKAIATDPQDAKAYNNLGLAMMRAGRGADESIAAFEKAIKLRPALSEAYMGLGLSLRRVGRFDASLAAFERGTASGFRLPAQQAQAAALIEEAQELVRFNDVLPAVLDGHRRPTTVEEQLKFARMCIYTGRFSSGVQLYREAAETEPSLAGDLAQGYRYDAACGSVMAASGKDVEMESVTDTQRKELLLQAIQWLEQDLAARRKQFEDGTPDGREEVRRAMRYWQHDVDLAALREPPQGWKEPIDLRERRMKLWEGVAALLWRAEQED